MQTKAYVQANLAQNSSGWSVENFHFQKVLPHDCARSAPVAILSGLLYVQEDVRWRQLFVLERPLDRQLTTWLEVEWFQWNGFLLEIFPVLCLSINSLVNPFLYALRHPKVKKQLNPLLSRCWAATRECFGNLRQNLRCHTDIEEPINNEVQEGRIPQGASLAEGGNDEVQIQPIHPQCPSHASELNCEV